ncbi:MAG TPA: beta-ketoacyl-[acyl-carrier-protein] synthase family protein [Geminicoccaceae bacterium]|nr:beta-ketoacyl-[acyl-carrier-protein] synthase family protein [Geminicoccus sp.]HMU51240.1 beta-ketoacyl-[acyl-carrier-protein] synthase family protein [Geminicoccaceae bacterium]
MLPLTLSACTAASALGVGKAATLAALRAGRSGLRPYADRGLATWAGRVDGLEEVRLPAGLEGFDCRNNRLAALGLAADGFAGAARAAAGRWGPERVAVVLGTSTSGIASAEDAYRRRDPATGRLPADFDYRRTQDLQALAVFVRAALGLRGPASVLSTACTSAAKAFGEAAELMAAGLCDAAVVGGVDSMCDMTLYGFNALELVSAGPCRPFDAERDGISIGEAAAFALLERPAAGSAGRIGLLGFGASADAHHMSTPHPEGRGAAAAMTAALASAGIGPDTVDYVNFHGTGTRANDAAEDRAVWEVLGDRPHCSSTKGWTGHALGTAGALEAVIAALCIERGLVPGCLGTRTPDPACRCRILLDNAERPVRYVLSNSFGFGGSNCSLLLGVLP